jgi:two-component system chemotaxis response regulator CheY
VSERLQEEILVELKGDITELEDELINYENRQARDSTDLLREPIQLFMRRAHSVKGKLRLANKPTSATVVHELESILDQHLKANTPLDRSYVDPLFDALDAVLDNLPRNQEDWSRLNTVLTQMRFLPSVKPLVAKPREFPFSLSASEFAQFEKARADDRRVVCIEKSIRTNVDRDTFTNLPIFEDTARICDFVVVRPAFDHIDRSSNETIITITGATRLSADELDEVIFDSWAFCEWPTSACKRTTTPLWTTATPKVANAPENATPRRLLIVEDDHTSRVLLTSLTRKYGESQVVENGNEAVSVFQQAIEAGHPFSVMFLDIMLPGMDGIAVLEAVRRLEQLLRIAPEQRVRVIMTTSLSDYQHFHTAFASACDSYLVKPVTSAGLARQLTRLGIEPLQLQ